MQSIPIRSELSFEFHVYFSSFHLPPPGGPLAVRIRKGEESSGRKASSPDSVSDDAESGRDAVCLARRNCQPANPKDYSVPLAPQLRCARAERLLSVGPRKRFDLFL